MLLTIDIGNTNIVLGFYDERRLAATFRMTTDSGRTADESALLISQFVSMKKLAKIDGIIIGSVVPKLDSVFRQVARGYFSLEPLFVNATLKLNITFDYPRPHEIGADRICNSAAVYSRYGGPTIVVDFGTATTFDIVSDEGAYIGGVIAPGIETAQSALAHRAAQLFKISFGPPNSPIGKSTEDAMKAGFYYGGIGQTDFIIEKISESLKSKPKVVATGGLAGLLSPASKYISEVLPDITLEGLRLIYEMNR